jgi:hypothetical protein
MKDKINRINLKEGNFSIISNKQLMNTKLSDSSFRFLVYALNNSSEWELNFTAYKNIFNYSNNKITAIKKELEDIGILITKKTSTGRGGKFIYSYIINEEIVDLILGDTILGDTILGDTKMSTKQNQFFNKTKLKQKESKQSESVSVEKYTSSSENFSSDEIEAKTDSDSYFDFISNDEWVVFDNGFESSEKIEIETDSDSKVEKETSSSHSNEKSIRASKKEYLKVEPSTEKNKFFFRVNEKADYHRIEEYFLSKGYSSAQALEMHKRLLSTNFKSASGEQIKFLDSYINRELQNIKPDLSNEAINKLIIMLASKFISSLDSFSTMDEVEKCQKFSQYKNICEPYIQELISKIGLEKTNRVIRYIFNSEENITSIRQAKEFLNKQKVNK